MALSVTALATETVLTSTAIAIFVKTPEFSVLKTRLAATIGRARAEAFYRLSVQAIEDTVSRFCSDQSITPYWAVAEQEALDRPIWSGFLRLYGGSDDLGRCQHSIYSQLIKTHRRVILIGADSPQLSTEHLTLAISSLDNYDFAIGPALDGGYYLFAGKAPIERQIWTSVEYSSTATGQQLSDALTSAPALLPPLTDVDTVDNFQVLLEQMPLHSCSPTQRLIRDWVSALRMSLARCRSNRIRRRARKS